MCRVYLTSTDLYQDGAESISRGGAAMTDSQKRSSTQNPAPGDVIQTGYKIQGCDEIQWGTHQIVIGITSEGIPIYRPREAKVDKRATYWRFPVETKDAIIRDLRYYANPKATRELLKRGLP